GNSPIQDPYPTEAMGELASTPPRHRARCTHLQTQPGRIQPIDSSQLAGRNRGRGNTGQTRTLRRPLDKRSEIAI
ncbi:hypothetical protein L546_1353, partial [Bordetella pertussis H897]